MIQRIGRMAAAVMTIVLLVTMAAGCAPKTKTAKLDPKKPVTIDVWHYYNGALKEAFDQMVLDFNDTVGMDRGIIVEGHSYGNISDLIAAVQAAMNGVVGSQELPNIFAAYSDLAYEVQKTGVLVDMNEYLSEKEKEEYIAAYLDEGVIGENNELRMFPLAKSTEVFLLNETDWAPFAAASGFTHEDLATKEGLVRVASAYYAWTDAQTPDVPNDGLALWGQDSMSNLILIGSKQLGVELFETHQGQVTINADKEVMRKLWDTYYVPYINGYAASAGKFRSDDARVGKILGYVGSSASVAYFPAEVVRNEAAHAVEATILPAPVFENGENVFVQQGAGMVVKKATPEEEYASVVFLKWAAEVNPNTMFSARSGYMPVKAAANDYAKFMAIVQENGIETKGMAAQTLEVVFDMIHTGTPYTYKAFDGATAARDVLDATLRNRAEADRAAVLADMAAGATREEAVAKFDTDANFDAWFDVLVQELSMAGGEQAFFFD